MTMTTSADARRSHYGTEAILSATPVRLLTMLYDRLLLDLNRAVTAQDRQDWAVASENLLHAQAIISELTASLKVDVWEGAESLLAIYNYLSTTLIDANIRREAEGTREAIALLEPLRQAWHEAADGLPASQGMRTPADGGLGVA